MNYDKNPRHAKRIAKEQKKLRQKAKKGNLIGQEAAICSWDIELDNYAEPIKVVARFVEDEEDEYANYG